MCKKVSAAVLASQIALVCTIGCNRDKSLTSEGRTVDLQEVLSWLPTDTETVTVANGPLWMSNFEVGGDQTQNRELSVQELEKYFQSLTLALFNSNRYVLEKHLEGEQVLFAVEGSRRFRPPAGLGMMRYEGCAIAIFVRDLSDRGDSFMKGSAGSALEKEEIEGHKVTVFKETLEQDVWTTFVAFLQKRVVAVCTDRGYLRQTLERMRGARGERALPETLPEWKHINKQVPFWGLRHFERAQAAEDPTSPFGGRKSANLPDEQAIGFTFECDPSKGMVATIHYLSGDKDILRKIKEKLFPSESEPEATRGLRIRYREVEPGVIEGSYDLDHSEPSRWFFFVLLGRLGHAIYL